jgi:hypothetical protein
VPLSRSPVEGVAAPTINGRLRCAGSCERWWGTAKQLDEAPEVLRGCCEQHLVPCAAQASPSKPAEPMDALHVRKSHLDLLALARRLLEGHRVGQGTDAVAHILVDTSYDLAHIAAGNVMGRVGSTAVLAGLSAVGASQPHHLARCRKGSAKPMATPAAACAT